jgi:hypothetical protein
VGTRFRTRAETGVSKWRFIQKRIFRGQSIIDILRKKPKIRNPNLIIIFIVL